MFKNLRKNLKELREEIKFQKEYIKEVEKDVNKKVYFGTDEFEGKEYIINKNARHLYATNSVFACVELMFTGFNSNLEMEYKPLITTDHLFNKLSGLSQEFVLQHELGHVKLGHFKQENKGRELRKELEADGYAAYQVGKVPAIIALQEMLSIIPDTANNKGCREEIELRIKSIKAL